MDSTVAHLILKNRHLAFAVTDTELRVRRVGGQKPLFHDEADGVTGQYLWDVVPELIGYEEDLRAIVEGKIQCIDLPLINRERSGDDIYYVSLLNLPFRTDADVIKGVLHVVEDVSVLGIAEQNLLQQRNELYLLRDRLAVQNQRLRAANAELQELDEIKSQFVSIAAHELNNPIASASMYTDLLMEEAYGALTEEQMRATQVLRRTLRRLHVITTQMLDVTRIETGRIELLLQSVQIEYLVRNVITELQPVLDEDRQRIRLELVPGLPPVLCDETRATQILNNLISNANKYSPEDSEIFVRVGLSDTEGYVQVTVADQGMGIAPHEQERLFERFFRATNARMSGSKGVGLGLSIVRSLVELHGGHIWFESELDKGTVFHITFPVDDGLLNG